MELDEKIKKRLESLAERNNRIQKMLDKTLDSIETDYLHFLKELEEKKKVSEETFRSQEENLKSQAELASKDFVQKKYRLERETNASKSDIENLQTNIQKTKSSHEAELAHLSESKIKTLASYEKQKTALTDLYEQKKGHLREKQSEFLKKLEIAEGNLRRTKTRTHEEWDRNAMIREKVLSDLKGQLSAKQQGWELALETMRRELEALTSEKKELEKKLAGLRQETEKELQSVRSGMTIAKNQLDVDKATLIEKAEADQKECEKNIQVLQDKVQAAETELQSLVLDKEKRAKEDQEIFEREESALKQTVQAESEKRDYEQKLLEQERNIKSKELSQMKEEYEKKKWYWDNQIRNLLMQKSVQQAEFDAERLRVDREARVALKSLEAKREELKQRLAELKSRHAQLESHETKEKELRNQRWQWRKDRLWSMWRSRLEVLRKERQVLQDQLQAIDLSFSQEREMTIREEEKEKQRADELHQNFIRLTDDNQALRKQKELQIELEKTRLSAQIKECETLITEWQDRLHEIQDAITKRNAEFGNQFQFLDRLCKEEESETETFLHNLRNVITALESRIKAVFNEKAA